MRTLPTLVIALYAARAHALDKQGAAHGSGASSMDTFGVSGSVLLGVALVNPSYAARPDNSGLALMRYAGHVDIDLVGQKLSLPLDVNFFSDGQRVGARKLAPTELDWIVGVTSTWRVAKGNIEMGIRFEQDRPLDRLGYKQAYADARVRYVFRVSERAPRVASALAAGDIRGWIGQGTFLVNPTYAARPDNSGLALFRYIAHAELSAFRDHVGFAIDTTWFTAREKHHFLPTELDLTIDLFGRIPPMEFHIAYERDMPVDRPGLVQAFVFGYATYAFGGK